MSYCGRAFVEWNEPEFRPSLYSSHTDWYELAFYEGAYLVDEQVSEHTYRRLIVKDTTIKKPDGALVNHRAVATFKPPFSDLYREYQSLKHKVETMRDEQEESSFCLMI